MSAVKGVKRVAKRRPRATQAKRQACDLNCAPLHLARATYLTVHQTMHYIELSSEAAVYMWAKRQVIPKCRVGRSIRFLRRDIDKAVQPRGQCVHDVQDAAHP